jgi:ribonuclease G
VRILTKEIVVDVGTDQTRIAVLEDKNLVELYIEQENYNRTVGNIYRGMVKKILPGMQAAFVDIGQEKNAFLYLGDIQTKHSDIPLHKRIKQGQHLTVQVEKEAMGTKGAKVTTRVSLPGKFLVLLPKENGIGISQKIENDDERKRLKYLVNEMKPDQYGIIVRTDAVDKQAQEIQQEIEMLIQQWESIAAKENFIAAPALLYKDKSPALRAARDLFSKEIDAYIVNNLEAYNEVKEFIEIIAPNRKEQIRYMDINYGLFDYYSLESQIDKALQKHVWLKSGGTIIIEHTEALTVIDVNTGKFVGKKNLQETILKTNIEAAKQIAKQIRLRNLAGIIIVDFIDMLKEEHKVQVLETLRIELKKDRVPSTIWGMTELGLVQITRKKTRQPLAAVLLSK